MTQNIIEIDLPDIENTCFVVMPFNQLFQVQYEKIIQPSLENIGIKCIRGDEIYSKQRIMDDIWNSIRKCRFLLAELTGKNPNVLYEIGLAHAIGKPIIILTRNADDVPFDLKDLRYLFYDVNDPYWGENLKTSIQNLALKIIENPSIGNYLEGIKYPKINYPVVSKKEEKAKGNIEIIDISGTWIGLFTHENNIGNIEHRLTVQINQHDEELFASSVSSSVVYGRPTVVQQLMNGTIKGKKILLHGVNYTFIERGNLEYYNLDSYELTLEDSNKVLKGIVTDPEGLDSEIILSKN